MKILVINAGSSSVKFTLFNMDDKTVMAKGVIDRIGLNGTEFNYNNYRGEKLQKRLLVDNISEAVEGIITWLTDTTYGVLENSRQIDAIGHRVVHGGEKLTQPTIIDKAVKAIIREYFELAPLHNPPNLKGIMACEEHCAGVPQVAVFDTAFHATIPEYAYLYGLPYQLYNEHKIRKYGFHGISHKYVSQEAARFINRPLEELRTISFHLGGGSSITAVDCGKSVDTSMGFTPLEGLIMGTRSGDLDPALVLYIMEHMKMDVAEINDLLNKRSGLLGLAEIGSSDLRDILSARDSGNRQADIAIKAYCYRIKKYIGAYTAVMGTLDVLLFTGGIGENSPMVRQIVCKDLEAFDDFGIILDPELNATGNNRLCEIQSTRSKVKILVVPTNEEKEIASQTMQLLQS
ncbi:MAG: acetate kinase [Desulfosarcina sp.]|nr:acetate kinase [Desulfosarcina sp.]MBC2745305.1 acetate kinase [Desulfosarcina sp.]MBC2768210.1 acetate kinase [Desulfosarcina sp.]